MDIFEELGIKKFINAHDTYTVYGGSRLSSNAHKAMKEISSTFVDVLELQKILGSEIARLTGNEDAYISNGSAGALSLCTAVSVAGNDEYTYFKLPNIINEKNEVIIIKSQRSVYSKSIETCGVKVVEIGNADETLPFELEGAINKHTAAVFFFDNLNYKREELDLETFIKISHANNVPVIVDAAANLPPKSNLTYYTSLGTDMVIFSGGKTLSGPQASGLIFGKTKYIDLCRRYGAPNHGVCRGNKTSREAMVALYVAVKEFIDLDEARFVRECKKKLLEIDMIFKTSFSTKIVDYGAIGQSYPRLFIDLLSVNDAKYFRNLMLGKKVFIGIEGQSIYYNVINVRDNEMDDLVKYSKESLELFYAEK